MDYIIYGIFEDTKNNIVYDNYVISSTGEVYSKYTNKFLKPILCYKGYYRIALSKKGVMKRYSLHRILASCFIENPDNFKTIDHIDRNRQNNNLSNLRWCSYTLQSINQKIRKNNTSKIKGVNFSNIHNSYRAQWYVNKKRYSKYFSVKKYENAKQLAIEYRKEMVEKYYQDIK